MALPKNNNNSEYDALWCAENNLLNSSELAKFSQFIEEFIGLNFKRGADGEFCAETYEDLHAWSVENYADFWNLVWDFCGCVGDKGDLITGERADVPWMCFFPQARLSYAENMLSYWLACPDEEAVIYRHQDSADRILSGSELCALVSRWEQALREAGIAAGDCVGVYLTNVVETDVILLAASNIGAVFCSAGMEMGGDDLIARFSLARPKILVSAKSYIHGAKEIDRCDILARAEAEISSIERVVLLEVAGAGLGDENGAESDFIAGYEAQTIIFERHDFNIPLYILFSSGSTGEPKCFVHGAGGVMLKHLEEHRLQADVRAGDRMFFHATPSWMMWNWAVSTLGCGATLLKYDGAPFYPDASAQLRFTAAHGCTHHGTAAPVIMGWREAGLDLCADGGAGSGGKNGLDMPELRSVLYTGAVLPETGFDYVESSIKSNIQISGISGGTDLVGCFLGGNIFSPVYAGQIAGAMLGMDVRIWGEDGLPVAEAEAGELVCATPFPSMPLAFLGDEDGSAYREAYFDYYADIRPPVWRHGDTVRRTEQGQYVIVGRSDATLNQNGVRVGSGVLYKQLDAFSDQMDGCAAVDLIRPDNHQPLTVLFIALGENVYRSGVGEGLSSSIKSAIKNNVGPYSVPSEIIAVPDVLRTPNGKLAEVVMKKIINGDQITNSALYGEDLVAFYVRLGQDLRSKYE